MPERIFWSLEEIAEYLNEAAGTVRAWVASRRIPFYKRGRRLQFKLAEIEKWDREKNFRPPLTDYNTYNS